MILGVRKMRFCGGMTWISLGIRVVKFEGARYKVMEGK